MFCPRDLGLWLTNGIAFNAHVLVESDLRVGGQLVPFELNCFIVRAPFLLVVALVDCTCFDVQPGQLTVDDYVDRRGIFAQRILSLAGEAA